MLSNFPVDTFDRTDDIEPRWPTLGIRLSARPEANQVEHVVTDDLSLVKAMVSTMINFHDQMHLDDPSVLERTIFVDTLQVKATDFDITPELQAALFASGRTAATKFLEQALSCPCGQFSTDGHCQHR